MGSLLRYLSFVLDNWSAVCHHRQLLSCCCKQNYLMTMVRSVDSGKQALTCFDAIPLNEIHRHASSASGAVFRCTGRDDLTEMQLMSSEEQRRL